MEEVMEEVMEDMEVMEVMDMEGGQVMYLQGIVCNGLICLNTIK